MSDQPETQVEQPTEQPIDQVKEEPKPPRRGRGKNLNPTKTSDPNYFKNYYESKTKPKLFTDDMIIPCHVCSQLTYKHNLPRHLKSKKCQLVYLQTVHHEQNLNESIIRLSL